jgi:hypothetical protein
MQALTALRSLHIEWAFKERPSVPSREPSTSGVYFVTVLSAAGTVLGSRRNGSSRRLDVIHDTSGHRAGDDRANAFQTRAVMDSMKLSSKSKLTYLGGRRQHGERDVAMEELTYGQVRYHVT